MAVTPKELTRQMGYLHHLRHVQLRRTMPSDVEVYIGQLPMLEYIIRHDGCTQIDLAEEMHVSPASIALSTKRMQNAGLIEKRVNEQNLRCKMLSATEKGRQVSVRCREVFDAFDERMYAGFSEQERETLSRFLERLAENLNGSAEELRSFRPGPPPGPKIPNRKKGTDR